MTQESLITYTPPSFDGPSDQAQFMTHGEQVALQEKSYNEGHQKGYADGQKHGHDTALQEHDRYLKEILDKVYDSVKTLKEDNEDYEKQLTLHVNYSVSLIIKKLFPFYIQREGQSELRNFVEHTLDSLLDKNGIKIFLHSSMLPHVKECMNKQPENSAGIHIMEDDTLDRHACSMKWKCGGGLYDVNNLHDKIDVLLKSGLDLSKLDSPTTVELNDNELVENSITETENV